MQHTCFGNLQQGLSAPPWLSRVSQPAPPLQHAALTPTAQLPLNLYGQRPLSCTTLSPLSSPQASQTSGLTLSPALSAVQQSLHQTQTGRFSCAMTGEQASSRKPWRLRIVPSLTTTLSVRNILKPSVTLCQSQRLSLRACLLHLPASGVAAEHVLQWQNPHHSSIARMPCCFCTASIDCKSH